MDDTRAETLRKWRRRALIAGVLLAITCRVLPVEYQGPCQAVVALCLP